MASLSKNKIKYIHSLEQKKIRKEERVFLAEGPKLVGDLLEHFPCRFFGCHFIMAPKAHGYSCKRTCGSFSGRTFTSQPAENSPTGTCYF